MTPKVAVVGTGAFGQNHVRSFSALGALAAVCDPNQEALDKLDLDSSVKQYTVFEDVLDDADIDGVVLATPAQLHGQQALDVFAAGKGCLVEKPISLTVADADAILTASEQANKPLMVGHLLLYQAALTEMKTRLADGSLGMLQHIQCRRLKLGRVRQHEDVLWSFAPHDVSVLLDLVGAALGHTPVVKSATQDGEAHINSHIEDISHLFVEFEGGMSGHVEASWLWPEVIRKTTVICSDGAMVWDELAGTLTITTNHIGDNLANINGETETMELKNGDLLQLEGADFLKALQDPTYRPKANGQNGADVVRVLAKVS